MSKNKIVFGSILLIILGLGLIVASYYTLSQVPQNPQTPPETYQDPTTLMEYIRSLPAQELNETEIQGILYMREEEKLARDVYTVLYEKWGTMIFSNIAHSEQIHMDMVNVLIEKYNLTDPVVNDTVSVFTNEHLQELYNELVANGSKSLEDALKVGALIEEVDIIDLDEYISLTDNEDVKLVYEFLRSGSCNHLRAFVRQLENMGVEYTPVLLSQEEYNEIISTTPARGYGKNNTSTTSTTSEVSYANYYFYAGILAVAGAVGLLGYYALKRESI